MNLHGHKIYETKGCVYVNESSLVDKTDFNYWVLLALEFNPKAKASNKKKRKRSR